MKKKNIGKIILVIIVVLLSAVLSFALVTFIVHKVKSDAEMEALKEKGYYNPVSVGDYCLNVAKFGNENGKHTIVGLAGLGSGDYAVVTRQMTKAIEKDNQVVFVDRAGYGFSDDTKNEMTLEYIVEDYRKALKNAGIEAPYVLMPHSIGGAYATYWSSKYPDEIEGIVFVDGSELSATAFEEEPAEKVGLDDKLLAALAKMGMSRYVLRDYCYSYPDNFSAEEQYLGDALSYLTLDSIAPISEASFLAENAQKAFNTIVKNDVPKLYICASWGYTTKEEFIENAIWTNKMIEANNLDIELHQTEYSKEEAKQLDNALKIINEKVETIIVPYTEKMGNCKIVKLAGDHMIYLQKPEGCSEILKGFVDDLG
ncbi:MAG: alpha/beta hydrolase [Acutalibacteraceae bacterium]|nr:alpha/beta hydrolase [Acutalibacteraceae bacterium]